MFCQHRGYELNRSPVNSNVLCSLSKIRKGRVLITLLPPANEVCEGYVFTGVCLSTGGTILGNHSATHLVRHTLSYRPPLDRHLADTPWEDTSEADTPYQTLPLGRHLPVQCMLGYTPPSPVPGGIWSTSRRYASHWNAFLLFSIPSIDPKIFVITVQDIAS